MATLEEKKRELAKLLGPAWAEFVFKQADLKEKEGDGLGLKYKERGESAPFSSAPEYCANPATGIGSVLKG